MRKYIPLLIAVTSSFFTMSVLAVNFSISEPRVVMNEGDRSVTVKVFNTSEEVQSFRVKLVDKEMTENGYINNVETSPMSAKDLLRVGPRMGRNILPGQFQKFRIRSKMAKAAEGEYRSHFLVESMLPPSEETEPGVYAKPNFKNSIPIILRKGSLHAEAEIINGKVIVSEAGARLLTFSIKRKGQRSLYGNVEIYKLTSSSDKKSEELIELIAGQAIYTDLDVRSFSIPLEVDVSVGGKLKIRYVENPEFGGDVNIEAIVDV